MVLGGHDSKSHTAFTLISKPVQRQRWGDHQHHPVVNWGDLFFDLFYVAAAYNLANIIRESLTGEGLLYFVGCFLGIYHLWWDRAHYFARFFTGDDVCHRFTEVTSLCVLATAVLHIQPSRILSNPTENNEMFVFCLSMSIGKFLSMLRYLEIMVWVDGEPVAKLCARRESLLMVPTLVFFIAATIYAGSKHYGNYNGIIDIIGNTTNLTNNGHRILAGETGPSFANEVQVEATNIPIILFLTGGLCYLLALFVFIFTLPGDGRHKKITIPMNVDFTIHRYGEWTMLMLGESILSLLIVDVTEGVDYYTTFYSGIVSVVLLQMIHFRSQPSHADQHAIRRTKEAGFVFSLLMFVYSAALVLLGVSYKMMLYEFVYESSKRNRQLLLEVPRWLTGGEGTLQYDTDDRQQRVAHFFCGSMATVWFCLDVMMIVHRGIDSNVSRCTCSRTKKMKLTGLLLVFIRAGLIVVIATLSQYVRDPEVVALIGLSATFLQLLLRILSSIVFPDERVYDVKVSVKEDESKAASNPIATEVSQLTNGTPT